MSAISIPPSLVASLAASGVPSDAAVIELASDLGWHDAQRLHRPKREGTRLVELVAAEDPLALIVLEDGRRSSVRALSLGYSREAPYSVLWSAERIELHDTHRWDAVPGDTPLISAETADAVGVVDVLHRLHRDDVLVDAPADLAVAGEDHAPLHDSLAGVLLDLRLQVAQSEAYRGDHAPDLDTAVLRLFHQLLYIRIAEDRRRARSSLRIADVMEQEEPSRTLGRVLSDYQHALNSELFEPAGVEIAAVPHDALRHLLKGLVEPWDKLKIDFSVTRAELAGRLYQSYLESVPAITPDAESRLFPVVGSIDQREKLASYYTSPALAWLVVDRTLNAYCSRHRPQRPVDVRVLDPACGSGAFLLASLRWLRAYFERLHGRPLRPGEREALVRECIFGADIDERALGMTQVQLLEEADLRGRLPRLGDNLLLGDALPAPPGIEAVPGAVDWSQTLEQVGAFTSVVTNPPFGSQVKLPRRLSVKAIEQVMNRYPEIRAFGQDYAFLFLALSRRLLTAQGTAGFVLPRTLLDSSSGRAARRFLADIGIGWIGDFRAAEVFRGVRRSLCTVVLDPGDRDDVDVVAFNDSREDARAVLDEVLAGMRVRRIRPKVLLEAAEEGWAPFRLRWIGELSRHLDAPTERLASPRDPRRGVHSGTRPAAVDRLVFGRTQWTKVADGIQIDGRVLPDRYVPRVVYASDIQPFMLRDAGRRVIYPFEADGRRTENQTVWDLVDHVGGLPANFRRGDSAALTGPKVLLRGLVREPASVADVDGAYVPIMRGVFAVRLDDVMPRFLPAVAALLNSALYQWLLRGFGAPLRDESVELSVTNIASLPVPRFSHDFLDDLSSLSSAVRETLDFEPMLRTARFAEARAAVDHYVFDALGASAALREIVMDELVRTA